VDAQVESADGETESAESISVRCLDSAAMSDVMSSATEPAPAMMASLLERSDLLLRPPFTGAR
jgi:hypothetical protein